MLKLIAVVTPTFTYLSDSEENRNSLRTSIEKMEFDGAIPLSTFHPKWVRVNHLPKNIQEWKAQPNINKRWELKDKDLASDKIPLVLLPEDVGEYRDEEYDWHWKEGMDTLRPLYEMLSDPAPPALINVPFEIVQRIDLDDVIDFKGFSYPVKRDGIWDKKTTPVTDKDVSHQLLDRILFPEIVLASRPCKLSSRDSYDIVRCHVQNNIDPKYAKITSDYDFCFAVEKLLRYHEPIQYQYDANWAKKRARPKMVTSYRQHRTMKVFEMTWSPENYKGYSPIQGFQGDSHEDLHANIEAYLTALIHEINKPIMDCPTCKGSGVIVDPQ